MVVSYARRSLQRCASGFMAASVLAAMIVVVPGLAEPAYAYGPTPCNFRLTVGPYQLAPGASFTLRFSGHCKNDTFTVKWRGPYTVLGTVTTNPSGGGSGTFRVPEDTSYGSHSVTATDTVGNSDAVDVRVVPPPQSLGHCYAKLTATSTVVRNGTLALQITGICDNDTFTARVQAPETELGTITTSATGEGNGSFTVPENLDNGQHAVWVLDSNSQAAATTIRVDGGPYRSGPNKAELTDAALIASPGLPGTHHSDSTMVAEGAASVLLVTGLITLRMRQRRFRRLSN